MTNRGTSIGPVAFFDLMGYSQINEMNDIKDVARIIIEHIDIIPDFIREERKCWFSKINMEEHAEKFAKEISIILLSDSILLTEKADKHDWGDGEKLINWFFFILTCRSLMDRLLDAKLLTQGAIGYGEYFRKKNCFAGDDLGKAVNLSKKINLAACVFVPSAWMVLQMLDVPDDLKWILDAVKSITFEYDVPMKSCNSRQLNENHRVIAFGARDYENDRIYNAFSSYNRNPEKDKVVLQKRKNTMAMIDAFHKSKL